MLVYMLSGSLECDDSRKSKEPQQVQPQQQQADQQQTATQAADSGSFKFQAGLCAKSILNRAFSAPQTANPFSKSGGSSNGDVSKEPKKGTSTILKRGDAMCLSAGRGLIYSLKAIFSLPTAASSSFCKPFARTNSMPQPTVSTSPSTVAAAAQPPSCRIAAIGAKLGFSSMLCPPPSRLNPASAPTASTPVPQQQPLSTSALEDLQHTSGLRIWLDVPRYAKLSEPCSLVVRGGSQCKVQPPASSSTLQQQKQSAAPGFPGDFACSEAGRCNTVVQVIKPAPTVSEDVQGRGWCMKRVLDVGCREGQKMGLAKDVHCPNDAAGPPPSFSLFDISLAPGGSVFQKLPTDHSACVYNLGPSSISIGDRKQVCEQGQSLPEHEKYALVVLDDPQRGQGAAGVWINNASLSKPTRVVVATARPTPAEQEVFWPKSNQEEDQFIVSNTCERGMTVHDWRMGKNGFDARKDWNKE